MEKHIPAIADKLMKDSTLPDDEMKLLLEAEYNDEILFERASMVRHQIFGSEVYLRGIIEFTNICRNNCYYCGIRRDNRNITRYRLTQEEILECCCEGFRQGYRTFVLQGGEDMYFTDERMCSIISEIKSRFPECTITLSMGERSRESYKALYDAGARRYLLRHETADECHYRKLHPEEMSLENRKRCLFDLKETGFETGSGFMVGSPYQTTENIIADLNFLRELQPHMIGIGTYITHKDTPFAHFSTGSLRLTLRLVSVLRLMFPHANIPATTALGTIHPKGREMGLAAGANVLMNNISPSDVRRHYSLYDGKNTAG